MTDQMRVDADVVAEPDTDDKSRQDQQREEHAPTKWQRLRDWWNWHYTWKKQQAQTIWQALIYVGGNILLAVAKLVYGAFAYGIIARKLWEWFGRPLFWNNIHVSPVTFIVGALTLAMAYVFVSFIGSIFANFQRQFKSTLVKPTPYFGDAGKKDVLDRIHANILDGGYKAFFYAFPFIVLAIGWVLK